MFSNCYIATNHLSNLPGFHAIMEFWELFLVIENPNNPKA